MKPPKGVNIVNHKYIGSYEFLFVFSNGVESLVNFYPIISKSESLSEFLNIETFKKIHVDKERGIIRWGENWDMCFGIDTIYNEHEVLPASIKRK